MHSFKRSPNFFPTWGKRHQKYFQHEPCSQKTRNKRPVTQWKKNGLPTLPSPGPVIKYLLSNRGLRTSPHTQLLEAMFSPVQPALQHPLNIQVAHTVSTYDDKHEVQNPIKIHSLIFFGNILGYLMLCLCCHGMERVPWRGGHGIVCSCILCDHPCRRCVYLYVVGNLMDHVCPDVPDVDPRHISSPNGSKFKPKYFARTFSFVVSTYRKKIDTVVGRRK